MQQTRKNILNAIFLIALIGLTVWAVFRDQDLGQVIQLISRVHPAYLVMGFCLVIVYVCSESVIIKHLLHVVKIKAPLLNCIRYSFIGFFYSCVTPFASGGQPMQIYYMRRQKIDVPSATIVLMMVTIEYKAVLIIAGVALAIFGQGIIQGLPDDASLFLYLGIGLNLFFVFAISLLIFMPDVAKTIVLWIYSFLKKIHLMKEKNNRAQRLEESMEVYRNTSDFLKKNKMSIVLTTLITFLQRFFLFLITYVVYRSFGLREYSMLHIVLLQTIISISVDMLPLPGGMGISEFLYMRIFVPVFKSPAAVSASMVISRGFSYYALVIVSGIVAFFSHIFIKDESGKIRRAVRKKRGEKEHGATT
ncbi:MAG: flippase-like domain-containing protein [Eubacterium sp.]|nr:flippase-like domain-containing protein [Eubacterium sp.]